MKKGLVAKPTVISQLHQEITGDEVSVTSLRNLINSWLQRKSSATTHPTFAFHQNTINRFLAFLFLGGVAKDGLPEITHEHITRFCNEEAKWLAPKTVAREVKLLRMIFSAAIHHALVGDDPAEFIDTIRSDHLSNEFADPLVPGSQERKAYWKSPDAASGRRRGTFRTRNYSAFISQGDYWTICYQGQTAILKATRGLSYLSCLLRDAKREIHVSELITTPIHALGGPPLGRRREADGHAVTAWPQNAIGPIVDLRAKVEYKRRIGELRNDLEEAERFNDFHRAARARTEMYTIANQLAAAVGLSGKDRPVLSDVERARSAVTKRIKDAIKKITEVIPPLGHHLTARIKTGYFCSYNPHPARSIVWKF
jgi:hypothetical protein